MRFTTVHVDELRSPKQQYIAVQLAQVYYKHVETYKNEDGITIDVDPALAPYPKALQQRKTGRIGQPLWILNRITRVRLAVLPFHPAKWNSSKVRQAIEFIHLKIRLDAKLGDHVDMLVPILPAERKEIGSGAVARVRPGLSRLRPYWGRTPATRRDDRVPEEPINRIIKQSINWPKSSPKRITTAATTTYLTGSWGYDNLWSTPTSMTSHMFLSLLGLSRSRGQAS